MPPSSSSRNKNKLRPIKRPLERRRRLKVQRRRLIALGVPEAKVSKLNSLQVRQLLKYPARLKASNQ
jgi:hypothetical protein